VRVNVMNADVRQAEFGTDYDVVLCNGVLHYVNDAERQALLARIQAATAPGGYNMVMAFTDHTPVPECHQIIDVYCDREEGLIKRAYETWQHTALLTRDKPETSHPGFPPHTHSMVRVLARKPEQAG
jgi:trans-aconitate methyltransferase